MPNAEIWFMIIDHGRNQWGLKHSGKASLRIGMGIIEINGKMVKGISWMRSDIDNRVTDSPDVFRRQQIHIFDEMEVLKGKWKM